MRRQVFFVLFLATALSLAPFPAVSSAARDVVRPEEIKSKRQVVYDDQTYEKLAGLWKDYYGEYPSEFAYANWMYAARYAGEKDYSDLLDRGLEKYPANPTLLYLKAIESHGAPNDVEGMRYLEKAIAIDPNFVDPWFLMVTHYMETGDEERLDVALRRILDSGIIADEVMDYNYNMIIGLEENAILITNGDNDTYPGWILTRILKIRPDVAVVNRSLLNTEWYPLYVIKDGLPRFIDKSELKDLRDTILKQLKESKAGVPLGGPYGDTLVIRIVDSAQRAGRPVYFSKTLYSTPELKEICESGRDLGLATLVTSSKIPYAEQLRKTYTKWTDGFRTGGLESWRLKNAPQTDAGRMLVTNYGSGAVSNLETLEKSAPEIRIKLFRWYLAYVEPLMPEEKRSEIAQEWCRHACDVSEISAWGRKQGLKCAGSSG